MAQEGFKSENELLAENGWTRVPVKVLMLNEKKYTERDFRFAEREYRKSIEAAGLEFHGFGPPKLNSYGSWTDGYVIVDADPLTVDIVKGACQSYTVGLMRDKQRELAAKREARAGIDKDAMGAAERDWKRITGKEEKARERVRTAHLTGAAGASGARGDGAGESAPPLFYGVQKMYDRDREETTLTVHSFKSAIGMSDWVANAAKLDTRRNKKTEKYRSERTALGAFESDEAALEHVYTYGKGKKTVVHHEHDDSVKLDPREFVNIRVPKENRGVASLEEEHIKPDGRKVNVLTLPEGIPPVNVRIGSRQTADRKRLRADISGGKIELRYDRHEPVTRDGKEGWRAGQIQSLDGDDCYQVGFFNKSKDGKPWQINVWPKDSVEGYARVWVTSSDLGKALDAWHEEHRSTREVAPAIEKAAPDAERARDKAADTGRAGKGTRIEAPKTRARDVSPAASEKEKRAEAASIRARGGQGRARIAKQVM